MFVVVQFPFVDMRGFIDRPTGRLSKPTWPSAEVGKDFIRSSGLICSRPKGGVAEWAGEELFVDASSALKFADRLRSIAIEVNGVSLSVDCAFRRFYSDGGVARMEVGLRAVSLASGGSVSFDTVALLRQLLNLTVRIGGLQVSHAVTSLVSAGQSLASHFLRATTDHKIVSDAELDPLWFCVGVPSVVVEHRGPLKFPPHTQRVLPTELCGSLLSHSWLQLGRARVSAWFLTNGDGDRNAARRLRIHLSRLHAERESLRNIVIHLQSKRLAVKAGSESSDVLQRYLNDTLHVLQRQERFGHPQSAILDAAREAFGTVLEGETASLLSMRRQVIARLQDYLNRSRSTSNVINIIQGDYMSTSISMGNVTVSGDFNVVTAKNIENSFNRVADAHVGEPLKECLQALTVQVAELAKRLPAAEAEQVTSDLSALTTEATSKAPRKKWLELSGSGLIDAAKTLADMAGPVKESVQAVLDLIS